MNGPGSVILVCVDMVLAVGAAIAAWDSARYARQARESLERMREDRP